MLQIVTQSSQKLDGISNPFSKIVVDKTFLLL